MPGACVRQSVAIPFVLPFTLLMFTADKKTHRRWTDGHNIWLHNGYKSRHKQKPIIVSYRVLGLIQWEKEQSGISVHAWWSRYDKDWNFPLVTCHMRRPSKLNFLDIYSTQWAFQGIILHIVIKPDIRTWDVLISDKQLSLMCSGQLPPRAHQGNLLTQ